MRAVVVEAREGLSALSTLLKIVVAVLCGVLLGLAFTINSLDPDRRGVTVGPWRSVPRDSGGDIDPYTLASDARAGLLPLGSAEGLSLVASTDTKGAPLESRCDYFVEGPMPPARYWTLSLLDPSGYPIANPANRYGFTSAEVLRFNGESAKIVVSARARSGNWLPVGRARGYVLMLRLYDTSLSSGRTSFDKVRMPPITRGACR